MQILEHFVYVRLHFLCFVKLWHIHEYSLRYSRRKKLSIVKSRFVSHLLRFPDVQPYKMLHEIQCRVFTPLENSRRLFKMKRTNERSHFYEIAAVKQSSRFKLFTLFHINRKLALFRTSSFHMRITIIRRSDGVIFRLNIT